jgi:hypothetical protein
VTGAHDSGHVSLSSPGHHCRLVDSARHEHTGCSPAYDCHSGAGHLLCHAQPQAVQQGKVGLCYHIKLDLICLKLLIYFLVSMTFQCHIHCWWINNSYLPDIIPLQLSCLLRLTTQSTEDLSNHRFFSRKQMCVTAQIPGVHLPR